MRRITLTALIVLGSVSAFADFSYSDFSSVGGLQLNGTATQMGNIVRLTEDQVNGQAGTMWRTSTESVGNGFSTTFTFSCDGVGDIPADGIAFGIQATDASQLGVGGGDNAMGGLLSSFRINFQSFWENIEMYSVDSSGNVNYYTSVGQTGLHRATPWQARVDYDGVTKDWSVYLDNNLVLTGNYDLATDVALIGGTDAYVGLGAGTGLGYDNNDAHAWELAAVPEPCSLVALAGLGCGLLRRRARASR